MSYVVINHITVPSEDGPELEKRFAARAGTVGQSEGFEEFQLLRPADEAAGDTYLVYTRWRSKKDFEAWRSSQSFATGHAGTSKTPVASASEVRSYEVIQAEAR